MTAMLGTVEPQGAYCRWSPPVTPHVVVSSNRSWQGTIQASENTGSAGTLTVASGNLKYSDVAPTSYTAAASASSLSTEPQEWVPTSPRGLWGFTHHYLLRSDWTDDPGTFQSTVLYKVSQ